MTYIQDVDLVEFYADITLQVGLELGNIERTYYILPYGRWRNLTISQ